MTDYTVGGLKLRIPWSKVAPPLHDALTEGRFEAGERRALQQHLVPGDTVLDLGAGCGCTAALAAQVTGAENVVAVEPDPEMVAVIAETFRINGLGAPTILQGAVVPGAESGVARLSRGHGFWSSRLSDAADDLEVPSHGIDSLLERYRPDIVIADLEGSEAAILARPIRHPPRRLIVELHPRIYGAVMVRRIFDGLSRSGMAYCPQGSAGGVVVFQKA